MLSQQPKRKQAVSAHEKEEDAWQELKHKMKRLRSTWQEVDRSQLGAAETSLQIHGSVRRRLRGVAQQEADFVDFPL